MSFKLIFCKWVCKKCLLRALYLCFSSNLFSKSMCWHLSIVFISSEENLELWPHAGFKGKASEIFEEKSVTRSYWIFLQIFLWKIIALYWQTIKNITGSARTYCLLNMSLDIDVFQPYCYVADLVLKIYEQKDTKNHWKLSTLNLSVKVHTRCQNCQ